MSLVFVGAFFWGVGGVKLFVGGSVISGASRVYFLAVPPHLAAGVAAAGHGEGLGAGVDAVGAGGVLDAAEVPLHADTPEGDTCGACGK